MLASLSPYASLTVFGGLGIDQPGLSYYVDPWAVSSQTSEVDPFAAVSLGGTLTVISLGSGVEPFQAVSAY